MSNFEIRRLIFVMEFFYGFMFGVAVLGATITFLLTPSFMSAILFSAVVFSFFIFLVVIIRYCIFRIKATQATLELLSTQVTLQEKIMDKTLNKEIKKEETK